MALRGSLADLGVVDLIQYPHTGRKTGELFIAGPECAAKLYYSGGKLIHVDCAGKYGVEGLVEVVSFTEGEFEFRVGIEQETASIKVDLHRAVMLALKTRDERLEQQRQTDNSPPKPSVFGRKLEQFVSDSEHVLHVSLVTADGKALLEASANGEEAKSLDQLRLIMARLLKEYPGQGLKRVFFEDKENTVVGQRLASELILLVVAAKLAPMGAVSRNVGKLADSLSARKESV